MENDPWAEGVKTLVHLMFPFAPFAAEEIWHRCGGRDSVHAQPWPVYDLAAATAGRTVRAYVAGRMSSFA